MTQARQSPGAADLDGALHEVSNALTVVLGWLDVARAKLPSGPERDAIDIARTHARLGYGVARQAIGAEVPELDLHGSARALLEEAARGVTPEADRQGVRLVLDSREPGHAALDDLPAALQILTNLLLNAIAFTPSGSHVRLSVRDEGNHVVFAVRDEGPGIAEERVATLFDGPPISTRSGGAGVGLRHAYALAAAHGGQLSVVRPGPGACFELRWPVAEARSSTRPQGLPSGNLRGARALVIEDDAAVRSLIELSLEARGVEVTLVARASEFDAAVNARSYDVALVDLSPIASHAPLALARLRSENPGISVILISGVASGIPDGLEREVSAWVRKPFEMGEVIDVMSRLLATDAASSAE